MNKNISPIFTIYRLPLRYKFGAIGFLFLLMCVIAYVRYSMYGQLSPDMIITPSQFIGLLCVLFFVGFIGGVSNGMPLAPYKKPVLTFDVHGITLYRVGCVPWSEIKKLSIVVHKANYASRRIGYYKSLVIELHDASLWQPDANPAVLSVDITIAYKPRIIVVDLYYLKTDQPKLIRIFKQLKAHNKQLSLIDHTGLQP